MSIWRKIITAGKDNTAHLQDLADAIERKQYHTILRDAGGNWDLVCSFLCAVLNDFCSSIQRREYAVNVMANLLLHVPDARIVLSKTSSFQDGSLATNLCNLLANGDAFGKIHVIRAIGSLVNDVPEFGQLLVKTSNFQDGSLATYLCNLLENGNEQGKGNATRAIESLVDNVVEFRSVIIKTSSFQDGSLATNLCNLLANGDDDGDKNHASWTIGSLINFVDEFRRVLPKTSSFQDGSLATNLCNLLDNRDDYDKGNAAWTIGSLINFVDEFRRVLPKTSSFQDGSLATNLCNLLDNGTDYDKGNAAWTIGSLINFVPEFKNVITKTSSFQDRSLATNLCNLLDNGDDIGKCNAACAIGSLVDNVSEFRIVLSKTSSFQDGSLTTNMCNLLENGNDNGKCNAAWTIASLVDNVPEFRNVITKTSSFQDGSLATNLCNLLANGNDIDKENAARTIDSLTSNFQEFGKMLLEKHAGLPSMLRSFSSSTNEATAKHAKSALITIERMANTTQQQQPMQVPASTHPRLSTTFLHESFMANSKEIDLGPKIGVGGFGEVYKGTWKGESIAIKKLMLNTAAMCKDSTEEIKNEVKTMMQLRSEFVVALKGITVIEDRVCLLIEWMDRGSLYDILHNSIDYQEISWKLKHQMALDAARGLAYLHGKNLLHRDMKSMNVLVNGEWRAKLCDFGMSKAKSETTSKIIASEAAGGSLRWMAPELFKLRPVHSFATDVFGLGVVFWEIASRLVPYEGALDSTIKDELKQGEREEIPSDCPSYFGKLISKCWSQDASDRPNAQEVVALLEGKIDEYPTGYPNWEELEEGSRTNGTSLEWTKDDSGSYDVAVLNASGGACNFIMQHTGMQSDSTIIETKVEIVRNGDLISRFGQFMRSKEEEGMDLRFEADGEKEAVLDHRMRPRCISKHTSQVLYGWHGCSVERARSICARGGQEFGKRDAGYFGAGLYLTLQSEYAAGHSTGTMNVTAGEGENCKCIAGTGRNEVEDKEYAMVFCEICVGNVYPITRKADYNDGNGTGEGVSSFCYADEQFVDADGTMKARRAFKAMKAGFDCHFISVSSRAGWQAARTLDEEQEGRIFDEIVVRDAAQVLPLAIVYFRPKYPKVERSGCSSSKRTKI